MASISAKIISHDPTGTADANKDRKLTMAELTGYVSSKVKEDAAIKGREQTPELQGSANRVLVKW